MPSGIVGNKSPQLACAVARKAAADHRAGGGVERREQRQRPVTLVVVAAPLGLAGAHGQQRLSAIERLHLRLLVDAQHDRALGRIEVKADDVAHLVDEQRVRQQLERLAAMRLHRNDHIADYGDKARVRAKVEEVVAELERLAKGTMTFSGLGEEVSFVCSCGEKKKRPAGQLREGQHFPCINPDCKITWKATRDAEGFTFESVTVPVDCDACKAANHMPWRYFLDMKHDEVGSFSCHTGRHKNYVQWRLTQVRPATAEEQAEQTS